jgi:hypothetical protein
MAKKKVEETKPVLITDPELLNKEKDIKKVREGIADIQKSVDMLKNKEGVVVILNADSQKNAIDLRSRVKKGTKVIEAAIKTHVQPLKNIVNMFTNFKKSLTKPLEVCDRELHDGLRDYQDKIEAEAAKKQAEIQKKLQEEQEKKEAKIRKLQEEQEKAKTPEEQEKANAKLDKEMQAPILPVDTGIEVSNKAETESSKMIWIDNWKARILDVDTAKKSLIDNQMLKYLKIDESVLNKDADVLKDMKQIPGIQFYNDRYSQQRNK